MTKPAKSKTPEDSTATIIAKLSGTLSGAEQQLGKINLIFRNVADRLVNALAYNHKLNALTEDELLSIELIQAECEERAASLGANRRDLAGMVERSKEWRKV